MKARLPKGYGRGNGVNNLQQLAMKAQQVQSEMDAVTSELEEKEYESVAPGGQVKAIVNGKLEVKNIEIDPEIVNKEDTEMMSDLIIIAVNAAIKKANDEKNEKIDQISGQIKMPNMPGLF